jgi:hypothetical protein
MHTEFWMGNLSEGIHLKTQESIGRKNVSERSRIWDSVDWIDLVQGRDEWWTVVKTVMNP